MTVTKAAVPPRLRRFLVSFAKKLSMARDEKRHEGFLTVAKRNSNVFGPVKKR
jgi:hypothetical protein